MAVHSANLPLVNKHVLLAITGSVAACKADRVIRACRDAGADVRVLLTESGRHFFSPELAGSLTASEVYTDQFDPNHPGRMPHIEIKRWADAMLVAPTTANRLLDLDQPSADDLLSTVLRAFEGPVRYAPAMNPDMWNDPRVQSVLKDYRDLIVTPAKGRMACGDVGPGRFPDPARIVESLIERIWPSPMSGEEWVISAGPTREPWDEIRHLSNGSSGRMGACLARVARWLGARVELVTGAACERFEFGSYETERVESTREMCSVVLDRLTEDKGYIGTAAVSDYRPKQVNGKIESGRDDLVIELEENPDIIREIRTEFPDIPLVGFSYDDSEIPDNAVNKATEKGMDAVVFNSTQQAEGGMGSDYNEAMFCVPGVQKRSFGRRSKRSLAHQVWLSILNHL